MPGTSEEPEARGWRPVEDRHGWAKTGAGGTARALVDETADGWSAAVVDAGDTEDEPDPGRTRHRWGPERFANLADAIAAAERHLDADGT